LEEDLVPALRSLSNVFDDVAGVETIGRQLKTRRKWQTRIVGKPGLFLIRDLGAAASIARELQVRRSIRASKTEGRLVISAKYKSSLNGDFDDIFSKTCGSFDRFDCALRFKYRAIPAYAG